MTKIHICSRREAQKLSYVGSVKGAFIISISDIGYRSNPPEFNPAGNHDVVRFFFDDLVDRSMPAAPKEQDFILLTALARSLYMTQPENVIVHCAAGISRSAAVALAIGANLFDIEGAKEHFRDYVGWICPNELIVGELDNRLGFDGKLLALSEWFVSESVKRHNMEESWEETV